MHEETVGSKIVKWVLIGVSVLFLVLMLLFPLLTVISEALRDGWGYSHSQGSYTGRSGLRIGRILRGLLPL